MAFREANNQFNRAKQGRVIWFFSSDESHIPRPQFGHELVIGKRGKNSHISIVSQVDKRACHLSTCLLVYLFRFLQHLRHFQPNIRILYGGLRTDHRDRI